MKDQRRYFEWKAFFEGMEEQGQSSMYRYCFKGMRDGTLPTQALRQAGLTAKDILYTLYGFDLTLDDGTGYTEQLIRLVMASQLPTAQALATLGGDYWQIDRETLKKACLHAGSYHAYLYSIIESAWCLRVSPPVWTTADVRDLRKKALKAYKQTPTPTTARVVAVSLLPPAEAQILMETGGQMTPAQLRTAMHRAPSPTYEKAVSEYADTLERT